MATTSYQQALRIAEALPREDQLRLIQELAEHTSLQGGQSTSIMELDGLGHQVWQQQNAQDYVNDERASWIG